MEVLAIIPARGASQRLSRKNLRLVASAPLIVHSIRHARRSRLVTRTVVSTEDPEIATVSREAGAEVIERPPDLASETASSESALLHVLQHLARTENYRPDLLVFLQCTSPVRKPDDIDKAVQCLLESGADSLFSATASTWLLWRSVGPWAESFNYDYRQRKREQDMGSEWRENGSIYVFRPWVLLEHRNRLGGKIAVYAMDYWSSFQIDSPEDLELCDWILRRQQIERRLEALPERVTAVVFDFDGVFTDNRVLVSENGAEAVICDRADGLGLDRLRATGIPVVVLSTETNPVVAARCRKVGVECQQGIANKLDALRRFASERGISLSDTVYVGNDLNDRDCLAAVGCGIAVADAHPLVRDQAAIVLHAEGGRGAVREVCDLILERLGSRA
ncbi:MAG: acylneuraminate cytidylyltransferase [Nitrospirae bacterium]|nr:acylneuraminate cytidylyltransferase [Nitrospirota bacterium]